MPGTLGIVIKDGRLKETDGNIIHLKKNDSVSIHWDESSFKTGKKGNNEDAPLLMTQ